jgi:hypothetical protein
VSAAITEATRQHTPARQSIPIAKLTRAASFTSAYTGKVLNQIMDRPPRAITIAAIVLEVFMGCILGKGGKRGSLTVLGSPID